MTNARWVRYSDKVDGTGRRVVGFRNMGAVAALTIQQIDTNSPPTAPGYYVVCAGDSIANSVGPFEDYESAASFVSSILSSATDPFFPELPA